jgi:hypothetical protein
VATIAPVEDVLEEIKTHSETTSTKSASGTFQRAVVGNIDEMDVGCCLEKLESVFLRQPQQKQFEQMEKRFSDLFMHSCLTVHSIEKIVKHAKEDGVPKALPSLNENVAYDTCPSNTTDAIHKSLLTIVNNSAYGSSGGGIICYYILTKYVKPLTKVRTLIGMLENAEKQDSSTIKEYFLNGEFVSLTDM